MYREKFQCEIHSNSWLEKRTSDMFVIPIATTAYSSIITILKSKRVQELETCSEILDNSLQEFGFLQKLSLTVATLRAYSNACIVDKAELNNFTDMEKKYLISLVIVMPLEFIRKYGYRKLSFKERKYIIKYWSDFGVKNFNVQVDAKFSDIKAYVLEFEKENQKCHAHACHLVKQAADIFIDSLPLIIRSNVRGLVRKMVFSLLEDDTCQVLGIIPSSWIVKSLTDVVLLGFSLVSGYLIPPSIESNGATMKGAQSVPLLTFDGLKKETEGRKRSSIGHRLSNSKSSLCLGTRVKQKVRFSDV